MPQIPHLTYCEEVTFDRMRQLRESLKADLGRRGIKLSYMPFLVKAASLVSQQPLSIYLSVYIAAVGAQFD